MSVRLLSRWVAVPTAALLFVGVAPLLLASPAEAAVPSGTASPSSAINAYNASATNQSPTTGISFNAPGAGFPVGKNTVNVSMTRTADGTDAVTTSGASVTPPVTFPPKPQTKADTVSFSAALDRANPGTYDISVFNATDNSLMASCGGCFTVLAYAPECTGFVVQSDGTWAVTGTSFPKSTLLRFVIDGLEKSNPANDDTGLAATVTTAPTQPTPSTSTRVVYDVKPDNAKGGLHDVVVRNTNGQYAICPQTFTVPKGSLRSDLVPGRTVSQLGQGANAVPFTLANSLDATQPGLASNTTVSVGVALGKTNGVSAVVGSADGTGLHLVMSASTSADLSNRTVIYTAPDGGFYKDPNGLTVELPPGVDDSSQTTSPTTIPAIIGQHAIYTDATTPPTTKVPVTVTVPAKGFSYDGGGPLVATLGPGGPPVPGLSVALNHFVGTPTTDNQFKTAVLDVSTIDSAGNRAAPGTYTLAVRNANGGTSPLAGSSSTPGDGSCNGCVTVNPGPVITSISPNNVSPGSNVSFTINGTGFFGGPILPSDPSETTVSLPTDAFDNVSVDTNNSSSTQIFVSAHVKPGATSTDGIITVHNPDDLGSDVQSLLTIAGLAVSAPTPANAVNDSPAQLTISGGPFIAGTTVDLEREGFTPIQGTVNSFTSSSLTATFDFNLAAPGGGWSVRVHTPNTAATGQPDNSKTGLCQSCFTVVGRQPTIATWAPASAPPGTRVDLNVVGDFFAKGSTLDFASSQPPKTDSGITVLSGAVTTDRHHLTVPILVKSGATTGPKLFQVVNADGTSSPSPSGRGTFTVSQLPSATGVSPSSRGAGSPTFTMTIAGANFASVKSVTFNAQGITAGTPTTTSATAVSVPVTIASTVPVGNVDVIVTNGDGGAATCKGCLTVTAPPIVSSVTPPVLGRGTTGQAITIGGSGFASNASVTFSTGVTLTSGSSPSVSSDGKTITASVDVAANAARGASAVTVSNPVAPDGSGGGSATCGTCLTLASPPGAPSLTSAIAGDKSVNLAWNAPDDGGSGITSYSVAVTPASGTVTISGTAATVSGLADGTTYSFTVTAQNGLGSGPASAPLSAKPVGVPDAPSNVTATPGNASATVSWAVPGNNGSAILSYTVTAAPGGQTASGTAPGVTVTGLANGTAYTFTVVATNSAGSSAASASSAPVTPTIGSAGTPTGLAATVGRATGTVDLSWSPPPASGPPVVRYRVTVSPAAGTIAYPSDRTATTASVSGLANGTAYTFTVIADNSDGVTPSDGSGEGTASSPVTATPVDVVGTPSQGSRYVALGSPVRVLDSRDGTGTSAGLKRGGVLLDLSSRITDPTATAAVLNVTVVGADHAGFIVAYPEGVAKPGTSNLNFVPGQVQANEVTVRMGPSHHVILYVDSADTHVIADLVGYMSSGSPSGAVLIAPQTPLRVLDTRITSTPRHRGLVVLDLTGHLPAGATSAVLNVTVTGADHDGFLVAYPADSAQPGTSNVNFGRDQTQANEVISRLSADNKVALYVANASAAIIVDLVGTGVPVGSSGQLYSALGTPLRLLDSRDGTGTNIGRKQGEFAFSLPSQIPAAATGVILNVTATDETAAGFIAVYPHGNPWPGTSNVNFPAQFNQANEVVVGLGADHQGALYVGGGGNPAAHVIVDIVGYLYPTG